MKPKRPPALATWLLRRFVVGDKRESLSGDLIERYQTRSSGGWYWRQVITAIAVSIVSDVRHHKLRAAGAALMGLVLYFLSAIPVVALIDRFPMQPFVESLLIWFACGIVGWIVARLYPAHQTAMVVMASLSVLVFESLHVVVGLALDGGRHHLTPQMLLVANTFMVMRPLSILLGGLSMRSSGHRTEVHIP